MIRLQNKRKQQDWHNQAIALKDAGRIICMPYCYTNALFTMGSEVPYDQPGNMLMQKQ